MAYLHRVALLLALLVVSWLPTCAHAAFPATRTNPDACTVEPCPVQYGYDDYAGHGLWYGSWRTACQGVIDRDAAQAGPAYRNEYAGPQCFYNIIKVSTGEVLQAGAYPFFPRTRTLPLEEPTYSCPANSTLTGASCTCNAGQAQNATNDGCVNATNNCPKANTDGGWWGGQGRTGAKSLCDVDPRVPSGDPAKPGCKLAGDSSFSTNDNPEAPDDGWHWGAKMTYTGEKCSPGSGSGGPTDPKREDDPQCPPPKVAGLVNGIRYCYTPQPGQKGSNSESERKGSSSKKTEDGNTTNTDTTSKTECKSGTCTTTTTHTTSTTNSTGGPVGQPVTTTTTTSCKQGPGCGALAPAPVTNTTTTTDGKTGNTDTKTTTTTTQGGGSGSAATGGGGGSGNGDGDDMADFCIKNPTVKMCKTEPDSSFGGACGAPPVCTGDAVQCAVAAATFKTNCALTTPPATDNAEVALYKVEAAKAQGDQTTGITSVVNIGPSSFDQTNLLGPASGVSDLSITVMGNQVLLPLSNLNVWFERFGLILRAITLVICARILIRG